MNNQTHCRICNGTIQQVTAIQTGGLCMPCAKGTKYRYVAYLSIDEFFSKCSSDYCLAPNLEPHPSNSDFKAALTKLSEENGVSRCVIPVSEFEDEHAGLDPYSDRLYVTGSVDEKIIAEWATKLHAEFYREALPGAEMPRQYSNDQPGWFLVWD